jgi:hypothetical protein
MTTAWADIIAGFSFLFFHLALTTPASWRALKKSSDEETKGRGRVGPLRWGQF